MRFFFCNNCHNCISTTAQMTIILTDYTTQISPDHLLIKIGLEGLTKKDYLARYWKVDNFLLCCVSKKDSL